MIVFIDTKAVPRKVPTDILAISANVTDTLKEHNWYYHFASDTFLHLDYVFEVVQMRALHVMWVHRYILYSFLFFPLKLPPHSDLIRLKANRCIFCAVV